MSRGCDKTRDFNEGSEAWKGSSRDQLRLRLPRRDFRSGRAHEHVDLAPNPEGAVEVDARLHREPNPRNQQPIVVGLVVVQVGSRAVQVSVDGVAGAVDEGFTKA